MRSDLTLKSPYVDLVFPLRSDSTFTARTSKARRPGGTEERLTLRVKPSMVRECGEASSGLHRDLGRSGKTWEIFKGNESMKGTRESENHGKRESLLSFCASPLFAAVLASLDEWNA